MEHFVLAHKVLFTQLPEKTKSHNAHRIFIQSSSLFAYHTKPCDILVFLRHVTEWIESIVSEENPITQDMTYLIPKHVLRATQESSWPLTLPW